MTSISFVKISKCRKNTAIIVTVAAILCISMLYSNSKYVAYQAQRRLAVQAVTGKGAESHNLDFLLNCIEFLSQLNATVPLLLIDPVVLQAISHQDCHGLLPINIKVGVDIQYQDKDLQKDTRFIVNYYKNETTKDFIEFQSAPRRIIPKNFATYSIGKLRIAQNAQKFIEFWRRSRLMECMNITIPRTGPNFRTIFKELFIGIPPGLRNAEKAVDTLAAARDLMVQFGIFPFLSGGTLLGWYRECSIIPHTTDLDMAILAENYNPEILKHLNSKNSDFVLKRQFGKPQDSFEFTIALRDGYSVDTDIFLMYPSQWSNGTKYSWVGGTSPQGVKYKYLYPIYDPYCAANLLGRIFWVTCTPKHKIIYEYGKHWYRDHDSGDYIWDRSGKNVIQDGKWKKEEMKDVYIINN